MLTRTNTRGRAVAAARPPHRHFAHRWTRPMQPQRRERAPRNGPGADFVGTGFAAVATAVSFLTLSTVGGGDGDGDGPAVHGDDQWQVVLAFALLAAGLLCVMHGMMLRDGAARAPAFVRRAADAAAAALLNAGGPARLVPMPMPLPLALTILLLCPLLEAWFDFI
ncbi:hypothetical protein GUJ93_ZPchr0004g40264 [Zizania palustris]|uniref:Uncharacterized protein n=1 Tax=Zizania palustris TaxID=103762 RepID=A0A8J5SSP0_ZIZPA|nr:hypothetical protein GUJ93_ZPchr0004g40264 [Zizania palustris]KAG8066295.1 hypothetical protein GUJ93_ZPchr0004g40264 [Zizania palustris]